MEDVCRIAKPPGFPSPLFFHQASVEAALPFFSTRAPTAPAASDPPGKVYDAFGLDRGSLLQAMGPSVWLRGLRAVAKGHFFGRPTRDTLRMSGVFFVRGRSILWHHRARHAGDHPDLTELKELVDASARSETG